MIIADKTETVFVISDICLFIAGVLVLFDYGIRKAYKRMFALRKLRNDNFVFVPDEIHNHLCLVAGVSGISGKNLEQAIAVFFMLSLCLGYGGLGIVKALFVALIAGSLPYLILKIKFDVYGRKSSYEGESLVSTFLNQYRLVNANVYEALEKTVEEKNGLRLTAPLLSKLLLTLRGRRNSMEVGKAIEDFGKIIGTNWSRMLAYNIRLAVEKEINITSGIEDILIQLRDARTFHEERKRLNSETVRIVVYMIPFLYFFTVLMSVNYIGLKPTEYLRNQFCSKDGLMFFLIGIFMFLGNIILIEVYNGRRFDY